MLQVDHLKAQAWVFPGGHVDAEPPAATVLREAAEELAIQADFHPSFGDQPLFVTESVTREPGQHVDVTLWFVLRGTQETPLVADRTELRAVRWTSIDHIADWAETTYAPLQVARFLAKLSQRLPGG